MTEIYREYEDVENFFNDTVEGYKGREFANFVCGVIVSDQADADNECFPVATMKKMEIDINKRDHFTNCDHDPRIPYIGKVLNSRIFKSKNGLKVSLIGVIGVFSKNYYYPFPKVGVAKIIQTDITFFSNKNVVVGYNKDDLDSKVIEAALKNSPDFVNSISEKEIKKSIDPVTVLNFAVPASIIYPFVKKYMEKNGEYIAEKQKQFISWIIKKITKKIKRRVLYNFSSPYKGCSVDFIIETDKEDLLQEAFVDIEKAGIAAKAIIDSFIIKSPNKLVYVYDHERSHKWLPSFLMTVDGEVYTDKPALMAAESINGLSFEGKVKK